MHGAVNDRFVLNLLQDFGPSLDLRQLQPFNGCFHAGADKSVAYALYNEFFGGAAAGRYPCMAPCVPFQRAATRDALVLGVAGWLAGARCPAVIKPHGTGCGDGIEFFLDPDAPLAAVAEKVDVSLASVREKYGLASGGLPYTICAYLDTAVVPRAAAPVTTATTGGAPGGTAPHSSSAGGVGAPADASEAAAQAAKQALLAGRKFELRIVVYRDGDTLRAFPSICKVARETWDAANPSRAQLINNITSSQKATSQVRLPCVFIASMLLALAPCQ